MALNIRNAEAERLAALYYQNFGSFTNIVPLRYWSSHILDPIYHQSRPPPQRLCVFFLILALGSCMDTPSNDDLVDLYAHAARLSFAVDPSHSVTLVQAIYLYVTFVMNGRRDRPGGETVCCFRSVWSSSRDVAMSRSRGGRCLRGETRAKFSSNAPETLGSMVMSQFGPDFR